LPQPRANTRLAAWLCAYPIGEDLASFGRRHHLHHRHTQQPEDPDLALGSGWPMTPGGWWLAVLRDLTGVSAAAAVLGWRPWRDDSATWRRRRGPLVVNAVILGLLVLAGQGHLYLLLWLLPLATWYRLAARVRTLAEHALLPDDGDPLRNARTTGAGWLARAFLALYRVNFHLAHHLAVFVPCWRLPTLHALLVARARGAGLEVAPSYAALVRRATSGPVS
jgi:fatty acid desaturase